MAKLQSISLGRGRVTYLPDGETVMAPAEVFPAIALADWEPYRKFLNDQGQLVLSRGAFLIEWAGHVVLVDLGFGPVAGEGPAAGQDFLSNLARAGVSCDAVTDVVFTHFHLDHVGWTSVDTAGKRHLTFPYAAYYCSQQEWDFWQADQSGYGPDAAVLYKPLAGKVHFVKPSEEILPSLTVIASPGHTPGMITLMLAAGRERVYFIGDVLHSAVQISERTWTTAFDADTEAASRSRAAAYAEMDIPNTIVAAGHFSRSVFGKVSVVQGQQVWLPIA